MEIVLFIETSVFTREIKRLLPEAEYRKLQRALLLRPSMGDIIPGAGGLRKVRWGLPGKGKRGALRIIYFWDVPDRIYLLLPYRKNEQEDLTPGQLKTLMQLMRNDWA